MRTLIYFILLTLSTIGYAQNNDGVTITVVIENLQNNDGKVSAALFNEATFMKAAPITAAEAKPENKAVSLVLENVQPGEYGIVSLHDLNENGRMDFEESGMPLEAYGVSGNTMSLGPPSWADAKFEVGTEDMTVHIKM